MGGEQHLIDARNFGSIKRGWFIMSVVGMGKGEASMTQKKPAMKKVALKKKAKVRKPVMQFVEKHHEEEQESFYDERQRRIAEAAYLIAEKRGFHGEQAFDDWLQAEAQVDAMFEKQR